MKKIIITLFAVSLLLTLSACSKNEGTVFYSEDEEGNLVTSVATTKKSDIGAKDTVKITIPLAFIDDEYRDNPENYATANGFDKVDFDEKKGIATIKMNALLHQSLLGRIGVTVMRNISSTIESEEFPYMLSLGEYADDFSTIEIIVDKEAYEKDAQSSLLPYAIAEYCMYYQVYTEKDSYTCGVTVIDEKSGETIETKQFGE